MIGIRIGFWVSLLEPIQPINIEEDQPRPLYEHYQEVISSETLPVPFGNRMPYGRRALEGLALECENLIIERNLEAQESLMFKVFQCSEDDPDSLDCQCKQWSRDKWKLFKKYYRAPETNQ